MKILIHIQADNELLCHEAFSMAFALASFDHHIQLWLDDACLTIIDQRSPKLGKMLSSLDMYDMPKAWGTSESLNRLQQHFEQGLEKQQLATQQQASQQQAPTWLSQLTALPSDTLSQAFDLTLHL